MLKLNVGSGQRPFGDEWRKHPVAHNQGCAICGISVELHPFFPNTPAMSPRTTFTHRYVPAGEWINVDSQPRWNPDVVADGAHMPMFEDGSADLIVLHHVLEHFGCGEAQNLLHECQRILVQGGSLLVFVPDMRQLARGWLKRVVDDQVYLTNIYGAFMGDDADRHRWGFTPESLSTELELYFRKALPFDWRRIEGADIAGPDWWILGMEAMK